MVGSAEDRFLSVPLVCLTAKGVLHAAKDLFLADDDVFLVADDLCRVAEGLLLAEQVVFLESVDLALSSRVVRRVFLRVALEDDEGGQTEVAGLPAVQDVCRKEGEPLRQRRVKIDPKLPLGTELPLSADRQST